MIFKTLTDGGFRVVGQASTGEAAIELALELEPDIITLDNILPDMIGIDVLRVLKEEGMARSKVFMVSAVGQKSIVKEGMELGATDYILKPFKGEALLETINAALEKGN